MTLNRSTRKELIMVKNVGGIDRILRIVLGLSLAMLAATGVLGPWAWLGLVVMATGVFSFCGLYRLLGIRTCPVHTEAPADTTTK